MAELTERKRQMDKSLETEILIRIAQIASSTLELREILDTITHVLANTLNKDVCSICLIKPERNVICIEAAKGVSKESITVFCLKDDDGTINNMFKDLKPIVLEDIRKAPHIKAILKPEADDLLSLLAVPIIRENEPIGILMFQTRETYIYSREEINLLTIISHNISAAIRNAELYRNVKTQLDELKVIHEIGKAITSILNIDDLLPHICKEVSKVFNVTGCILRLIEGENLQIKAAYGLPDKIKQETDFQLGEGIAGYVALTGEALLIDDTSRLPDNLRVPGIEATSVICVPLTIGERIIGTLGLYDKKDEWGLAIFTQDDLDSLMTFASVSAIAIENARLYRAEIEKEKEVTQTKDYLKSLIDDSADAIITSDTEGIITSWNKGAENIYGYTEDEVIGKFLPMVPPFLIEEEKNFIRQIQQKETLRNLETIRQTKNGRLIEVSLTLSPILDSSGNVTAISGISRDISERKMVEKELIRKNQELSRLFFINSVVRSTLELDRLLKMVLTVVTMGDGLGFNRAILFLVDESKKLLQGKLGVGPANPEEAKNIWLSMEGKSLGAIIEEIESGPVHLDSHLDRLSRRLSIKIDGDCILSRCIKEKRPFNISNAKTEPLVTPYLIQMLGAESFGIVPLISRDKVIGLIWVDNLFTGRPIKDEDLQFLMGFSSHIASAIENARLFENVSLARAELRNIFESISDMVYFTDKDYTVKRINQAVVKKIGKPEEEIIGGKCYKIFHGKEEPWEMCPHFRSENSKKPYVGELEDPYLGGTFVVSSSPIFDSSGNFVGTVHISRDVTELRNLRERVVHAERMAALGELAARVAHEIRNPLISIGGFARRLDKKLTGNSQEYAKIIVNEVSRLENILKEILGFVKSSKVNKSSVNINDLMNNVIDFITPEMDEKENKIIREFSEVPIMVLIDPDRIKEAILNIVSNAAQATDHGTIRIRTGIEDNEAVIELTDTGCGIRDEDLKNIFNPFFTTKAQGTGLGLAVTHKIIQEHNGKIKVESIWGGGTAFRIYLPLEEGQPD
ncbi:MAG TPA: PAS domain S-box protein [Nitrospirae bacterium]|nr:sensor protein ZraS [bacterium BMS3Abin06]HDH12327.1 PAS domain S-box protein [Nitrospirota bacterium]HDZ00382.1 PAS domain S-box protein [Nitrospirota bacterium]